ncbi:transcriptional regulator, TetR family [Solimonas aquatica]|uniref:Transcriptional regulator, TetR family n=1 Tax=Solimonas aquatica TaxID=489703 RepID=A0A1H9FYS5_9GAMM|nr:TetR/AcrR family transcriptional regulator [Solimonas aquatica]SEQ43030.1 transcriptional regulator, TetR family [Solimonas aquatica]
MDYTSPLIGLGEGALEGDKFASKKKGRRKRDPDGTRIAILEAAGILLAKDGPEGVSVSQVAKLAKVNRGTAYQHFQTREQLLDATTAWVSQRLTEEVFGSRAEQSGLLAAQDVIDHLVGFAMENPELGRVWLFEMLTSNRPANDAFWKQFNTRLEDFAKSEYAQPGIDCEVHSVLILTSTLLWPVWVRAHARSAKDRQQMAKRFSAEMLRMSLNGIMRPEKFAQLTAASKKLTPPREG